MRVLLVYPKFPATFWGFKDALWFVSKKSTQPPLGLLAYLPLPVRFRVRFGEPMRFDGPFDDEDEAIDGKVQQVMAKLQKSIDEMLVERPGVFS